MRGIDDEFFLSRAFVRLQVVEKRQIKLPR